MFFDSIFPIVKKDALGDLAWDNPEVVPDSDPAKELFEKILQSISQLLQAVKIMVLLQSLLSNKQMTPWN